MQICLKTLIGKEVKLSDPTSKVGAAPSLPLFTLFGGDGITASSKLKQLQCWPRLQLRTCVDMSILAELRWFGGEAVLGKESDQHRSEVQATYRTVSWSRGAPGRFVLNVWTPLRPSRR